MAVSPGGRPMDTAPFSASTTSNWVARGGGLPNYVRGVAHALLRSGRAKSEAQAISMAVGLMQDWAAGRTPNGKGHVHPQVQAAAAAALAKWNAMKASAHANEDEDGAAMTLTWNGTEGIALSAVELGSYVAPHVPAGSPKGGQFGTTSGGKGTPAQQHAAHDAHLAHLQHLVATGKATPAQKAELAGLMAGKPAGFLSSPQFKQALAAVKASAVAPKAKKVKAPAKPTVNKTKGTVTATVKGKKVTMSLHQWHALHAAHQKTAAAKAAKLAGGDGRFLELAFAEVLAERVPPGRSEGGQFAPVAAQLSRHDTPDQAARVINAMEPVQRAVVRASTLPPPGFSWRQDDRLTAAELAQRLAAGAEVPGIACGPPVRQSRLIKVQSGRGAASVAHHPAEPGLDGADVRQGVLHLLDALRKVSVPVHDLGTRGHVPGLPVDHEALSFPHPRTVAQEAGPQ